MWTFLGLLFGTRRLNWYNSKEIKSWKSQTFHKREHCLTKISERNLIIGGTSCISLATDRNIDVNISKVKFQKMCFYSIKKEPIVLLVLIKGQSKFSVHTTFGASCSYLFLWKKVFDHNYNDLNSMIKQQCVYERIPSCHINNERNANMSNINSLIACDMIFVVHLPH